MARSADGRIAATAIVLAGGRSSRFGSDKMAAELRGRPLLHHAIRAVAAVCDEVIVVGASSGLRIDLPADLAVSIRVIADPAPYEGPLVAFANAAREAQGDRLLLVGGDMPDLQEPLLRRLLDWPETKAGACLLVAQELQPMPLGLERTAAVDPSADLVAAGERRLRALIGSLDLERIKEHEWRALDPAARSLCDIDRPEDLYE